MNMVERAREIAKEAHEGQMDKAGAPYYLHPFHVADQVCTDEEKEVAYLHDVIEDTELTLDDLRREGFSEKVICAIDAMSRRSGETYEAYLQRAAADAIARTVKMADLLHNADESRYALPTERERTRSARYRERIAYFCSICGKETQI